MRRCASIFACLVATSIYCWAANTNGQAAIARDKPDTQQEIQPETKAALKRKTEKAESIIAQLREVDFRRTDTEAWAKLIKQLVDLGPAAVDPICKALRSTDADFELRAYGFALRAIGDPRAVQALIESLPKTLLPPSSDYGLSIANKPLMEFMCQNDTDEFDVEGGKNFSFGRPVNEINGAITKLTKHKMGSNEIAFVALEGGPLQLYLRRKLYYDYATRWSRWWIENYASRGVEMDYVEVELKPFEFAKPKVINEFTNAKAQVDGHSGGMILEAFASAEYFAFFDLDTGRTSKLPKQFDANSPIEEVSKWARDKGFDLMGIPFSKAKNPKSPCVLKPLGMKAWQNPTARYLTIDGEIGTKEIKMGTPVTKYLTHFDSDSGKYDPDRQVTFLFQTKEGTCGAIKINRQITELLQKDDYGKPNAQIPENRGSLIGVSFDSKQFVSP